MYKSFSKLFISSYNKNHRLFAVYRFVYWKIIRALKLRNVKFKLWQDRLIYLNYDSFQSMWIMYNYIVDWEEFNLIKKIVRKGDTVFDVGANMGFYTIWMSKFIGTGDIHSFEPDDKNFNRISKNVSLNELSEVVQLNKVAVGNCDGEVNFTKGLDGENHIAVKGEPSVVVTPILKLDTYAIEKDIHRIRYCKIDVEGFEYAVLKGASELLLSKSIDILQLEINNTLNNTNTSVADLAGFLKQMGYQLCYFDVQYSLLRPIIYNSERENYFAVSDIDKINNEIQRGSSMIK